MAQKDKLSKTAQIESIDYLKGIQMTIETIHNSPAEQMPQLLQNIGPSNYHDVLLGYILKGKEHLLNVNPLDYEEFYVKSHALINHGVNTGLLSQEDANLIKSTVNEITETAKKNAIYFRGDLHKQQTEIDTSHLELTKEILREAFGAVPKSIPSTEEAILLLKKLWETGHIKTDDIFFLMNKLGIKSQESLIEGIRKLLERGDIKSEEIPKVLTLFGVDLDKATPEQLHDILFKGKLDKDLQQIGDNIENYLKQMQTKTLQSPIDITPQIDLEKRLDIEIPKNITDVQVEPDNSSDIKIQITPPSIPVKETTTGDVGKQLGAEAVPPTKDIGTQELEKQPLQPETPKTESIPQVPQKTQAAPSAPEKQYIPQKEPSKPINVPKTIPKSEINEQGTVNVSGLARAYGYVPQITKEEAQEMLKKLDFVEKIYGYKAPEVKEHLQRIVKQQSDQEVGDEIENKEQEEIEKISRRILEKSRKLLSEYTRYFDSIEINYEKIEEEDFLLIAHLISDLAPYSHVAFLVNELIKIKGHYSDLHDEVVSIARHLLVSAFETLRIALINHISEANNYIQKYLKGGEE